jgi:hypothetical protein
MPCNIQAKEESQALLEPLSDVTLAKRKFWVAFFGILPFNLKPTPSLATVFLRYWQIHPPCLLKMILSLFQGSPFSEQVTNPEMAP